MRRNSENLLVLAVHESPRKWTQPVALVDVLRAAVSEIEQYDRITLNVQSGLVIAGRAASDVVHLVAELVENATTFSRKDTQVFVAGQLLVSGGVLIEITDEGLGIPEQELAYANWRLDNPPVVDVAVSRRMGLFVVGRLAARHGVRVRLRHAQSGGLTALIWLPESVAAPESGQPLGRLRKFEADDYGPAPSLSAPTTNTAPSGFTGPVTLPSAPAAGGNGFTGAAATAARIPRIGGGGPAGNGADGNGSGGFPAFGGAGGGQNRPAPAMPGAPNGSSSTIDAPGGPLPVRTPGNHPLAPAAPASGGGSVFGADPFSDDFTTTRLPAVGGDGGSVGTAQAPASAPAGGLGGLGGSDGSQVTVPPTVAAATDKRLPIFDSLESDWFRRSGKSLSSSAAPAAGQAWNSPADEGYRAARIAASPEASETTTAGLPKRVPRANLVPGSVGGTDEVEDAPPVRSADTIRSRMSSFQRGVREARAAAPETEEP